MNPKQVVCRCINSFGEGGHPLAEPEGLRFFAKDYQLECLAKAEAVTEKPELKELLRQARAFVEGGAE